MPYLRQRSAPGEKMARLLRGYGMTGTKLAAVLGCSERTARSRINSPYDLTFGELIRISERGHVPIEEIREAVTR